MWFGTQEGITLYDGNSTITYKPWADKRDKDRTEALYGNHCDFIRSNREGDVFFRTDAALMRYDIRTQEFRMVRSSGVKTVSEYNGDIWCVVEDSLFTYVPADVSLQFRVKTSIQNIFSMLVISEDTIWLGTHSGLYLMENGAVPQVVIPDKDIYSIFKSSSQEIWVGSRMEGLYIIAPGGTIRHYREESVSPNRIANNQIREFTEDSHGNIWFGTFKGLQKFNPHTGVLTLYTEQSAGRTEPLLRLLSFLRPPRNYLGRNLLWRSELLQPRKRSLHPLCGQPQS
jgi:ligand-binding sensor domain-containing protein